MKILGLVSLALLASSAAQGQDYSQCMSKIDEDTRAYIATRISSLVGTNTETAFAKALVQNSSTRWTCSKSKMNPCCNKIPVTVSTDNSGACFVSLPYVELYISTTDPTSRGAVTWELVIDASVPADIANQGFLFDAAVGIKQLKKPNIRLPAGNPSHAAGKQKFKLESTLIKGDEAGHVPRVYPRLSGDDPDTASECTYFDPLIKND